jgi:hypothetical protein
MQEGAYTEIGAFDAKTRLSEILRKGNGGQMRTASRGIAQSPTDGKVTGNSYVNSCLKFSYTWPGMLVPYDTKSLNLRSSSTNAHEFLLFSARQGDEPYGVVVIAERLNAVLPHSRGFRNGADFLDWVVRGFLPEQHAVVISRKHFTTTEGLTFDQLDYTENGGYSSAVATPIGEFLVAFKCNAKSAASLAEMNKSVVALRILK